MELRHPSWKRDRIDNDHLRLLMAFAVPANGNCIDVGAHRGKVLADMVRIAPHGSHIAFEPLPELASRLQSVYPNVTIHQAALSDSAGTVMYLRRGELARSRIRIKEIDGNVLEDVLEVQTLVLDEVLPPGYCPSLIKIDVEGAEGLVLRGARETLRAHRPIVWFEHANLAAELYGSSSHEVHAILSAAGMRIFDADGGGPYTADGLAHNPKNIWSYVATPASGART
jgi:FkbM family methyltransferase